ncbi:SDR family NAD(P)-dependent oxidoreductase [Lentzea tibetensis]|uniref:SDR family NAD(P)-dependent oxidoreductase n=1 Tax=Lentzea tibetensis TaxID=2591470 RepID=A0A563ESJ3_9PSEU|nr:type I polyketide synthase [Lentzea tibetensis]TWP50620.1 SDR family NAD(P)-dependent oxidoreductase [Lentzea tibetensis]
MSKRIPVAVVGVSALLPGSSDVDGFWRSVLRGEDQITDVPSSHWLISDYYDADPSAPDKTYGKRGAFLSPVDFDPLAFGMPPNQIPATDTTQLLSLIVAEQVLRDATGGSLSSLDRDKVSVILGTAPLELLATMASRLQRPVWLKALREHGVADAEAVCDSIASHYVPWQEASFPGLLSNVVAGRIANKFDLHGTNCTTDAACASSLAALQAGVNELMLGTSDMVITGGVDTLNDITMYMCFSKTPALSPSGDCKPFSSDADGTILGEGLVMFALKRLADAERDGDHVYAVLKGVGTSSDGRSTAIYAPLPEGQARALRRAYSSAGYGPETVELVEAHGTGTTAGDLAEFTALRTVFSESGRADSQWCALGSVKSQIGHTKSAAGAAGMLKAVLSLHHKVLPPTIKVDAPSPKLDLASSPLYLNTEARPWIRSSAHPRRASVSSFGFGGSNFHLTLEEYVPGHGGRTPWRTHSAPAELVLLSAATPAELVTRAGQVDLAAPLADIARSSQTSFVPTDEARLAVVAKSAAELATKLSLAVSAIASGTTVPGVTYACGDPDPGQVGFLFSGQGSQYVGMGGDLAMEFPAARAVWDSVADVLPVHQYVFPVPVFSADERSAQQTALTATEWAQPALAAASLAQLALLDSLKVSPDAVAGHSFGELVALHTAGSFDSATLVRLARQRGEAMQAAGRAGSMMAVSASHADVLAVVSDVDGVWIANHNAPSQVVVSGTPAGIAAVESHFTAMDVTCRRLDTSTAFHSPLVASATTALASFLGSVAVSPPRISVYGNTDASVYPADPAAIRSRIAGHLAAPVRFVDEIEAMYAAGVRTFVEVGAGSTLTGLVGKILGSRPFVAVSLDRKGQHGVTALFSALGQLAVNGVAADFDALWAHVAPPAEPVESKPRMVKKLSGANYGKPYPPAAPVAVSEVVVPSVRMPDSPVVAPAPVVAAPAAAGPDLEKLVLDVVADKTGYPVEMLAADMDLEADLGIDSIKRVEILATVRRTVPGLPDLEPTDLGKLRTLGEIISRLGGGVPVVPTPAAPLAVVAEPVAAVADLEKLVLDVVADKTGYPAEMLAADMDLEADLGIDSIKRVEILATVRRTVPGLPTLEPTELGKLRTLGEIISRLHGAPPAVSTSGDYPERVTAAAPVAAAPVVVAEIAESLAGLEKLVLDVVADKTGYPAEMLAADMDLEADLGIDSIKRVEILSAVRRAVPGLPEVDPVELGKLRTLGEITDRLGGPSKPAAPVVPAQVTPPVAAPVVAAPVAPVVAAESLAELEKLVLDVVADKTGYPAEMLASDMDLEADLGIDSIKRVEILSAVRRAVPGLPEVDPVELGKLRTLGEITERLGGPSQPAAQSAVAAPVVAAPVAPVVTSEVAESLADLEKLVLDVVADKTGYPAEMLASDMDLEADLGIDSIKRVEILSAVRRAVPGLPEVDPVELGKLRTLGEITERLGSTTAQPSITEQVNTEHISTEQAPSTLVRLAVRTKESDPCGLTLTGLRDGRIVVTDDGRGVAAHVVARLKAAGIDAEKVDQVAAGTHGVIHLGGLKDVRTPQEAREVQRDVFEVARTVAGHVKVFVTVQDTGGDFGISGENPERAWVGGIAGLTRTAAAEWPEASVKAIDCERGRRTSAAIAEAITRELLTGGSTPDIGLSKEGKRTRIEAVAAELAKTRHITQNDVIVATGGARGVTAEALIELARQCRPKLVLLGRTERQERQEDRNTDELKKQLIQQGRTPRQINAELANVKAAREVEETIRRIREAGSEVVYEAVDTRDEAALAKALAKARQLGPITGIVHGAGVIADKAIAEKTDEQFDRVFDTKVGGLRALLDATRNDPIRTLCLFSSISAFAGNPGQCDYAMANEVLNHVAHAHKRPGCVVKSIAWGPWEGGMVNPALAQHFHSQGVPLIPISEGARQFVDEVNSDGDVHVVIAAGEDDEDKPHHGEIQLSARTHPYLEDHDIAGAPVVPIAMALEWFTAVSTVVEDVKVLRKIRLDNFHADGDRVKVSRADGRLEITGHYRARIGTRQEPRTWQEPGDLQPVGSDVYDGHTLFHGPKFQVIEEVHGVSDGGAVATVTGARQAGWCGKVWNTDPAAVDGGLQLAVLWARHVLGKASLPMSVAECRTYQRGLHRGRTRCVLTKVGVWQDAVECDIAFIGEDGTVISELFGVSLVARS